jgi:hypothetical protein
MSIPLDRLYHYIESVAQEVHGNTVIYRFNPHGSKKLEDLDQIRKMQWAEHTIAPSIYCYDQEPLDYAQYQVDYQLSDADFLLQHNRVRPINLRYKPFNVYDKCILLHSELNSVEVEKYLNNEFIPVYYWSHALIALDWFRYAQHVSFNKLDTNIKPFLIYNRAWSGTREYRLKFMDLLISHNLVSKCKTSCNAIDPELQIPYTKHQFINSQWIPVNKLEKYLEPTSATSCSSADFSIDDYNNTEFEVVLETLFDDTRNHLTEKVLRPIACGQPFLILGTAGSLKYLQRYGFKTFSEVIDESYDNISNANERMQAVINVMSTIINWSNKERQINMAKIHEIANYNQRYFFSNSFLNLITNELTENLKQGLDKLEHSNTGKKYLDLRKKLAEHTECKQILTEARHNRTRQDIAYVNKIAREYYNRYLKTLNK